jgi:hypothetical protein
MFSALPSNADTHHSDRHVSEGPEADDETERLGIPKATISPNFSGDCVHLGLPYEPTDYTLPK